MAGFGMINPRMGALAKKKAMAAKTAAGAAAAPGKAPKSDQTRQVIKQAGRQPPGPPMTAGPAAKTAEKAPFKKKGLPGKKGPVKGANNGRGDSGGVM